MLMPADVLVAVLFDMVELDWLVLAIVVDVLGGNEIAGI